MSSADADATSERNSGAMGNKLKESGTAHWSSPNNGVTNESGFTGLRSGLQFDRWGFTNLGDEIFFWLTDEFSVGYAWHRVLYYGVERVVCYTDLLVGKISIQ